MASLSAAEDYPAGEQGSRVLERLRELGSERRAEASGQPAAWPSEANQTIRFAALRSKTISDPDFKVGATASSGLPVLLTASGRCTIRAATVHLTGIGSCTITASQPGDTHYNPARPVSRTISITTARPTVQRARERRR